MRRRAAGEDDGQMEDVYRVAKEQGLPLVDV
jgi:hypothetical protein